MDLIAAAAFFSFSLPLFLQVTVSDSVLTASNFMYSNINVTTFDNASVQEIIYAFKTGLQNYSTAS